MANYIDPFGNTTPSGLVLAASNHDMAASGGFLDGAGEFLSKTLPLGVLSGAVSLINAPVDIASIPFNLLGIETDLNNMRIYTEDVVASLDETLGTNAGGYYQEHKDSIDMVGFLAGSLVPGMLGVKALRMGLGAAKTLSPASNIGRSLGLLERVSEKALLSAKTEVIKGTPFSYLSSQALQSISVGAATGIVETLAFNTAATLALHKSPYLDKKSGWELTKDAVTDSLIFGGATGAFIDYAGRGAGLLGYRKVMKAYEESNASRLFSANNVNPTGVGEILNANVPVTTYKAGRGGNTGTMVVDKEFKLPAGDVVASVKLQLEELKAGKFATDFQTKSMAELQDLGLLSKDTKLAKAELDAYNAARLNATSRLELTLEKSTRNLLRDVEDVADVNSIVKQFTKGALEDVAGLTAGAKKVTLATEEFFTSLTDPAARIRSLIVNVDSQKVVSNPKGLTAWDLDKAHYNKVYTEASANPEITIANISAGKMNGMKGSALYRNTVDTQGGKILSETEVYNLATKFHELDVMLNTVPEDKLLGKVFKVETGNGIVDATPDYLKTLIESHKASVVDWLTSNPGHGMTIDEITTMLHIPNAMTGLKPLSLDMKPSHLIIEYNKAARPLRLGGLDPQGSVDAAKRVKLAKDTRDTIVAALNKDFSLTLDMSNYKGSGSTASIGKYADAGWKDIFGQELNMLSKFYDNIFRKKVDATISEYNAFANNVMAYGRTSKEVLEVPEFSYFSRRAQRNGGGMVLAELDDGTRWAVTKEGLKDLKQTYASEIKANKMTDSEVLFTYGDELLKDAEKAMEFKGGDFFEFLRYHTVKDNELLTKQNLLRRAHGQPVLVTDHGIDDSVINFYNPPPNIRNQPYALVIIGDATHQNPLYRNQSHVEVFKDKESLIAARAKAESLGLKAHTTKETSDFYKAIDMHDNNLAFNTGTIKSEMKNKGVLTDSFLDGAEAPEEFFSRFQDWGARKTLALERNTAALANAEQIAQLQHASYVEKATRDSRFNIGDKIKDLLASDNATPHEKIVNQLLNVQTDGAINAITKTFDYYGNRFLDKAVNAFRKDKFDFTAEDTEKILKHYDDLGVEKSYATVMYEALSRKPGVDRSFDKLVRTTNVVLATGQLRLDPINWIVNIIGSPILGSSTVGFAISKVKADLLKAGKTAEHDAITNLFKSDGFADDTINFVKLAHNSVGRRDKLASDIPAFSAMAEKGEKLSAFLHRTGITLNGAEALRNEAMQDMITGFVANAQVGTTTANANKIFGKMKDVWNKYNPADFVESELQFIAADAGIQIAEAAKLNTRDTLTLVNTIVQKIQGNFTASQKPQVFQGTVGAALGLFQSYQARLIHRILDIADAPDAKRKIIAMAGLQAGIFGGKSLPFFDTINEKLIADNNPDKQDLYSGVFGSTDRKIAEGLLYGSASALLGLNVSTRGAVDFRAPSGVTSIPAVNIWQKQITQIGEFVKQAANGGDLSVEFNHALQHNVFNRPLQNMAALWAGYTTSGDGKLNVRIDDPKFQHPDAWLNYNLTNAMRAFGAKPLDEAVYMDTLFRFQGYRMADKEATDSLGRALRSKLLDNSATEEDLVDFQHKYIRNGGTVEGFNRHVKSTINSVNLDAGERLRKLVKNSGEARQLNIMLGGEVQPEFQLEASQ